MNNPTIPTAPVRPGSAGLPGSGRPSFGQAATSALAMKWSALHDAAAVVATLAGQAGNGMSNEMRAFPTVMHDAGGWRQVLAGQGIDDLAAIMEPGLAALLAAHARGADTSAPALALWEEFLSARAALLALTPPPTSTPLRMT